MSAALLLVLALRQPVFRTGHSLVTVDAQVVAGSRIVAGAVP